MPSKRRNKAAVDMVLPEIPKELLDQFVTGPMTAEAVEAAPRKFKKAIIERALGAEMSHHLGYGLGRPSRRISPTTATAGVRQDASNR